MKYLYPFFDNSGTQKSDAGESGSRPAGSKNRKGFFRVPAGSSGTRKRRERDKKMIKRLSLLHSKKR